MNNTEEVDDDEVEMGWNNGRNDNIERVRRQQILQLGLILCLLLALMDGGQRKNDDKEVSTRSGMTPVQQSVPSSFSEILRNVVNSQHNSLSANLFSQNVSGMYRGEWRVDLPTVAIGSNNNTSISPKTKLVSTGKMFMQLRSVAIPNVQHMEFVYGVVRMYGAGPRTSDLQFPLQGVSLNRLGIITLLSSPFRSQQLYLQLPKEVKPASELLESNDINLKNSTKRATYMKDDDGIPPQIRRALFSVEATSLSENGKEKKKKYKAPNPYTQIFYNAMMLRGAARDESLLSTPLSPLSTFFDIFAQFSYGESVSIVRERINDMSRRIDSGSVNGNRKVMRRRLAPPTDKSGIIGAPLYAEVGDTGLKILLLDADRFPPHIRSGKNVSSASAEVKNETYYTDLGDLDLLYGFGDAYVPQNFKNLQVMSNIGVADSFNPLFCGFSIQFKSTPMTNIDEDTFSSLSTSDLKENMAHEHRERNLIDLSIMTHPPSTAQDATSPSQNGIGESFNPSQTLKRKSKPVTVAFATGVHGTFDSKTCGMNFNVSAVSYHLRLDVLEMKAANYSLLAVTVCVIQICLLIVQLRYTQNQAASSKISIAGVCAQSLLDSTLSVGHLLLCAALPKVFFSHFFWIAVLKLVIFFVFEMRSIVSIYQARYSQLIDSEGWYGFRRRLATLHLRFYGIFFLVLFLAFALHEHQVILVFMFYSCWLPQIIYNAWAGTRKALHPIYYCGMAITRLYFPLYYMGCPKNFLRLLMDPGVAPPSSIAACITLVLWTLAQISFIALQDWLGPRFFIPKKFLPAKYDYHRNVEMQRLPLTHSISTSLTSIAGESDSEVSDIENGCLHECVICYNAVELTYGTYMITPCDHLFHTECLSQWLEIKLECPVCRASLPPE